MPSGTNIRSLPPTLHLADFTSNWRCSSPLPLIWGSTTPPSGGKKGGVGAVLIDLKTPNLLSSLSFSALNEILNSSYLAGESTSSHFPSFVAAATIFFCSSLLSDISVSLRLPILSLFFYLPSSPWELSILPLLLLCSRLTLQA